MVGEDGAMDAYAEPLPCWHLRLHGDDAADNTPVDINYEARDVGGRGSGGMMQMNVDSMVVTADAASSA